MTAAKTYTIPCSHCGAPTTSRRRPVPNLRVSCADTTCLHAVTAAHNADVARYDAEARQRAAERRAERKANPQPRRQPVAYGDWGMLCAFVNGSNR